MAVNASIKRHAEAGRYILTATGDASVIVGQSFDVTYVLSNIRESVYTLDQTILTTNLGEV